MIAADFPTDKENDDAIYSFAQLTEHPAGWNLIFKPKVGEDSSAKGIVKTVKEWRAANGKPGFKIEIECAGSGDESAHFNSGFEE
ncbi:bacteriocin immunity protein [Klebsiella pneumoniae]|nr:bacteriocin immunity protein [Klebsiella pneumoniae]